MIVVDLFAGCGGWDLGARELGMDPIGLEIDADACATRAIHDMPTIRCDVSAYPSEPFRGADGLIISPPCGDWSMAGNRRQWEGESGRLVAEVPRWVERVRPRWVACEQVPPVLPVWREYAETLRSWGYRTWVGILSAERYGVPQTRRRAFLLAHRDRPVSAPPPTHQRFIPGCKRRAEATLFDELSPWVSIADALGESVMALSGSRPHASTRWRDEPSTTILASDDNGGKKMWMPATTVLGDSRLPRRGHHSGSMMSGATPMTIREALVLQTFPADFRLAGNKEAKFRQVGNAVPPLLARRVLEVLT